MSYVPGRRIDTGGRNQYFSKKNIQRDQQAGNRPLFILRALRFLFHRVYYFFVVVVDFHAMSLPRVSHCRRQTHFLLPFFFFIPIIQWARARDKMKICCERRIRALSGEQSSAPNGVY